MDIAASTVASPEWVASPGLTTYPDALAGMQAHVKAMQDGHAGERVWLLEHPPLYTAGTSAKPEDLASPGRFPEFATGRGGQWTYHGPGQRVAYVMLDLTRPHARIPARDLHAYVEGLERWLILALAEFGVAGERRAGRIGVWVAEPGGGEAKIAAIGVRVTKWISWHGVSVNLDPDLSHFTGIVPCGIRDYGVTSLRALGVGVATDEFDAALRRNFGRVFERS